MLLSFHDTVGDKDTLVIILPPTSASVLLQVAGRHNRAELKSDLVQVIIFVQEPVENSIQKALDTKLDAIMNLTIGEDADIDLYDFADMSLLKEKEI